ncbi:MAG: hypothetical protein ACLFVU_12945 [Phycisphaerae bacterium]
MDLYLSFIITFFLILFTAAGIYRLWSGMVKPRYVDWALLPGTLVAEMAYILGTLITGGEVRRAKLLTDGESEGSGEAETGTGRFRVLGLIVASLLSLVACGGAIVLCHYLLGTGVIETFIGGFLGIIDTAEMPRELPGSWDGFWEYLEAQLDLLRRMTEAWTKFDWADWRTPLFVYLVACLSVRLAPARRDMRWYLLAVVLIAGVIGLLGAIFQSFDALNDLWPLLTYIWANLLFLLTVTLLIRAVVALVRMLMGK